MPAATRSVESASARSSRRSPCSIRRICGSMGGTFRSASMAKICLTRRFRTKTKRQSKCSSMASATVRRSPWRAAAHWDKPSSALSPRFERGQPVSEDDMTYSVTTPQDVAWFWSRFRDMDWHELVLASKHELSPDEFVNLHTELYTASKDGTPIAMFGVNEGANEMYVTCLGTNEMMKYMVKLTRGSRGFLEFRAELYSPKPLVVAVYEHNYEIG